MFIVKRISEGDTTDVIHVHDYVIMLHKSVISILLESPSFTGFEEASGHMARNCRTILVAEAGPGLIASKKLKPSVLQPQELNSANSPSEFENISFPS